MVNNRTCQMDHIVELQVGGNNTNENIQALDAAQNRNSGSAIRIQVFGLAREILDVEEIADDDASQVQLRFEQVEMRGTPETLPTTHPPTNPTCLSVEYCARQGSGAAVATDGSAPEEAYRISAGGAETTLRVPQGFSSTRSAPPVAIDGNSSNQSASELISGLLLTRLRHVRNSRSDRIDATLDTRNRTRLPLTMSGDTQPIEFNVGRASGGAARALRLRSRRQNLQFQYPYLSPGRVLRMSVAADGQLNWTGEIRPSVPFLPSPLQVRYENDELSLAVDLSRHLRSPIPGFSVTEAELSLGLAPTLSANGRIAFALGRGSQAIATGSIDIGADAEGFTGTGRIDAQIPGVDEASGTIRMQNGITTGHIVIESTQIRLPNVQRGRLQLDIDASGIRPSGEIELLLPRDLGSATLGFTRQNSRFVYIGRGTLRVPGLHEVEIRGRYDGETLVARANNVGFSWRGLDGSIDVRYVARGDSPGRVSGTGRLTIARGGARGILEVQLNDSGRFSGRQLPDRHSWPPHRRHGWH
jgi:hypothetical protein